MRRLAALALLLLGAVAQPASAQVDPVGTLVLDLPVDGPPRIAIEPATTSWQVPWRFTFSSPASATAAAVEGASIAWSLGSCDEGIALHAAPTAIPVEPGTTTYEGVAELGFSATPPTPGMVPLPCELTGTVAGAHDAVPAASDTKPFPATVDFVGGIIARVVDDHKAAGPQKQISYEIEITNQGNARAQVLWELVDGPGGQWNAIIPEAVLVDPAQTAQAYFTVATPFDNGYNNDRGSYVIRLLPAAAGDPTLTTEPIDLEIQASAQGWYIPGPSPLLVLAFLLVGAFVARRR